MLPDDPRHGTNAGHRAHYQPDGDRAPCEPCKAAHATYKRTLWRRKYLLRTNVLYVDAIGTARRIRALQAIGWRLSDIDQALGHGDGRPKGGPNYAHNLTRQTTIHRDTALKVARVYDALSMTMGPSARTRALARKYGWPPPLCWDDDIDDPRARPKGTERDRGRNPDDVDPVIVDRLLDGQRIQATRAEKEEAMRRWLADGKSAASLCRTHGWQDGRYIPREDVAS